MKKILRFVPSVLWMGIIFYFSSRQTTGIGGNSYLWRIVILKSFHIVEYSVLAILLFFATNKQNRTLVISLLYAFTDEIHQGFVSGRTATLRDIFFDLSGIFLGLLILDLVLKNDHIKKLILQKRIK